MFYLISSARQNYMGERIGCRLSRPNISHFINEVDFLFHKGQFYYYI